MEMTEGKPRMADAEENQRRLDKHSDKIESLDRRVTYAEADLSNVKKQMDTISENITALNSRIDSQHGETTRQLGSINEKLGTLQGTSNTRSDDRRTNATVVASMVAAGSLALGVIGMLLKAAGML